jgi:peptidoglycan glycosyltransferase
MMTLGDQLGKSGLEQIFANFGFTQAPELPLNTETPESVPLQDPPQAGLGQDNLLVTPLQVALAWGALGTNGRLPVPQLVTAVQAANSEQLTRLAVTETGETAVAPEAALTLRRNLAQTDGVLEHAVLVLSGPEGEMNAWYLGLTPAGAPRYALVIVVENSKNLDGIIEIGRQMLAAATE